MKLHTIDSKTMFTDRINHSSVISLQVLVFFLRHDFL